MARYWIYLNDEVAGPYGLDQLIRLRGFSRQSQVCVEEAGGTPKNWISPAEIPELAHIFKAVDEHLADTPRPAKATAKPPVVRFAKPYTPAVTLKTPSRSAAQIWGWIIFAALLLGGGAYAWSLYSHRGAQTREQEEAKALVQNVHFPAPSPYTTLPQYFADKGISPRWQFEKIQEALYHVTLSWYAPALAVYAFEVNLQAQTVRGLNSAASQLLSEGFPAPPTHKTKAAPEPKKSPADAFPQTIDRSRAAVEGGDFQTVWDLFSQRKKSEMAKAGISQDGFVRLQGLTHRVESAAKQKVLKTKQSSETEMLALIKQTQEGHPDVFIKQLWIYENDGWKLDDEQKKSSEPPKPQEVPLPTPGAAAPTSSSPPTPATLPGMSN